MAALTSADPLAEICAREEIRDVLARYCHAIDRRQWNNLAAVFWPDARVEYGLYDDRADGFVPVVQALYEELRIDITQHFIGNCILRVTGNEGCGETYVHALHRVPAEDGTFQDLLMGSRYLDTFRCRDGEWRISARKVAFDWLRVIPDSPGWDTGAFGINAASAYIGRPTPDSGAAITRALEGLTNA
ncbi:MAG: nuclear transport factor 2 family protein [Caenibius sp.]